MNIFVLDTDPTIAAKYHCDKHAVKMPLEVAQMLCALFEPGDAPYKRTHYNHPCTVWARQSKDNFMWLYMHGIALCEEYTRRYGKVHKSQAIIEWCRNNVDRIYENFIDNGLTPFAQAMPDGCKDENPVTAYRNYYIQEKAYMAKWEKSNNTPDWWPHDKSNS
jgi:hypothetical protein